MITNQVIIIIISGIIITIQSYFLIISRKKNHEKKFKALFISAGDAALIFQNEKVIDCNEKALNLLRGTRSMILGLHPWDFSPSLQPDGRGSKEKAKDLMNTVLNGPPIQFEWQHKKMNGELLDLEISLSTVDSKEKIFFAIFRDITNRKRVEKALKESEEKFKYIFNSVTDAICIIDFDENILEINEVAEKTYGYAREEFLQLHPCDFITPEYYKKLSKRAKMLAPSGSGTFESVHQTKAGKQFPVETSVNIITYEGKRAIIALCRDITEKKQFQRRLYSAMVESEEKERERYARELHDGLGPILSTCKIYFHTLKVMTNESKRDEHINRAGELLEDALDVIKEISNNLSPHILRNYGLVHALDSFIKKLSNVSTIHFSVQSNLKERLPEVLEFTLYRNLVELINNSVKYAKAEEIGIIINKEDKELKIEFYDNGKGFDFNSMIQKGKGFGLLNLEQRIKKIDGIFQYDSKPGKGVKVTIQFKLKDQ